MGGASEQTSWRYEVAIDTYITLANFPDRAPIPVREQAADSRAQVAIRFEGYRFVWHPGNDAVFTVISTPIRDSNDYSEERFRTERLLSAISFLYGSKIIVANAAASGIKREFDPPLLAQGRLLPVLYRAPDQIELVQDPDLSLCLALMREGRSSTAKAFAFPVVLESNRGRDRERGVYEMGWRGGE